MDSRKDSHSLVKPRNVYTSPHGNEKEQFRYIIEHIKKILGRKCESAP